MTQATIQEPINYCEEPASKKIKLETDEHTDLLEDVNILDDDEDDGTDDEVAPFPLTFTTPADLMWLLRRAEIIPSRSVVFNYGEQRKDSRGTEQGPSRREEERVDIRREVVVDLDIAERINFIGASSIIRENEVMSNSGVFGETAEII